MSADSLLAQVFAVGIKMREDRHAELLSSLTERERGIFRDAAIAGYVRGAMSAAPGKAEIPPDSVIVDVALDAIGSFPDLYRTVSGHIETEDEVDE